MDADAKLDAALGRHAGVALDHAVLHFDRETHRVHYAAELHNGSIAGALDDAAMVHGDYGINQIAADRPKPRQRTIFVRAGEPRIADDVGHQDRGDFARFPHGATPPRPCQPFRGVRAKPLGGIAKTREECRPLA